MTFLKILFQFFSLISCGNCLCSKNNNYYKNLNYVKILKVKQNFKIKELLKQK